MSRSRLDVARACLVVFVSSCAVLVLELVASRVLAPFIGSTLHTWTSIIGVVLLGISLGAWVGGRLADRPGWPDRLGPVVALGALTAVLPLLVTRALGDGLALRVLPVLPRTFFLTLVTFFPMAFVLSLVTPLALRRMLGDVANAGRITGLIYALGTVGSLAGNFLTGFVLTAYFPTTTIVLATAAALVLLAVVAWPSAAPAGASAPAAVAAAPPPPAEPSPSPLDLRGNVGLACAVVAFSSFCTLLIEIGASRMLAPTYGVSLFSWTGIIGVVLLGMAAGNYLGGILADRYAKQTVLSGALVVAAASALFILPINKLLSDSHALESPNLMRTIVLHTALVFLVPIAALGTISPQVVKLALAELSRAGRTVGLLYAWSTAGAIAGSFATGWFLIATFGVNALVFASAVGLLLLGAALGGVWKRPRAFAASAAVGALALAMGSLGFAKSQCTEETDYFCIKVYRVDYLGHEYIGMQLDMLLHALTRLDDPSALGYPHDYIQGEIMQELVTREPSPSVLVIGGGGYVFPRWIEHFVPSAKVDVVEIDPAVTRVALEKFGVKKDTKIRSFALDGRQFVAEVAEKGAYDLIVQDAVNDLSVPYHLLTKEYDQMVKQLLKPNGVYLLSAIDDVPRGGLLRAAIRTMKEVFPHVTVLHEASTGGKGQSIYMVCGSMQPFDVEKVRAAAMAAGVEKPRAAQLSPEAIQAYLDYAPAVLLTDEYAPVDNLLAQLFLLREEVGDRSVLANKKGEQ